MVAENEDAEYAKVRFQPTISDENDQLGPQFGRIIGNALKAHFDDLAQAPVPAKFMELLAQLENSGKGKKS